MRLLAIECGGTCLKSLRVAKILFLVKCHAAKGTGLISKKQRRSLWTCWRSWRKNKHSQNTSQILHSFLSKMFSPYSADWKKSLQDACFRQPLAVADVQTVPQNSVLHSKDTYFSIIKISHIFLICMACVLREQ